MKQNRRRKPAREDKPMPYIAFIAVLFGAAGVAGGIEAGNGEGVIAAAVIHIGGVIALTMAARRERAEEEDGGRKDKPAGRSGHADSGADQAENFQQRGRF